ncbi:MAG: SpoIIE family protein phosphatase [Spirochaetia bacterium]|jgi:hypothetical protein|nr:SpoIIE family protein phosphatase [Spirochaetia bacterium]
MLLSPSVGATLPDFYWETPARLSRGIGAYPQAIMTAGRVVVVWQENVPSDGGGNAWLSLASYGPEGVQRRERLAGPFWYQAIGDKAKGEQNLSAPSLFSVDDDGNGTMLIAASSGVKEVSIYESKDGGLTITALSTIKFEDSVVAPRVFSKASGGWYLFMTKSQSFTRPQAGTDSTASYESLSIFYTRSEDGRNWAPLLPFVGGQLGLDPNFLPSAASLGGSDVIVFQTLSGGARPSYQLYTTTSQDGGVSWSEPIRVTDFIDPVHRDRENLLDFDNQRPHLRRIGDTLWVAWERRLLSGSAQIYAARLDANGRVRPDSVERVTLGQGNCSEPKLYDVQDSSQNPEPAVAWFDDRRGNSRVFTAFRSGNLWTERDLSGRSRGDGAFGRAIHTEQGLYAFWQTGSGSGSSVLAMIPDTSVTPPSVRGLDFSPDQPSKRNRANVRWSLPDDSSGILGFSYLWSRDPKAEPIKSVMALETTTQAGFDADEDGAWYFTVRAQDYAGNWSASSRITFIRDTTAPGVPMPEPPLASADGFIASNSFSLTWSAPPEKDVAGYTWILEYLGPLDRLPARKRPAPVPETDAAPTYKLSPDTRYEDTLWTARVPVFPQPAIRTVDPRADFSNIDDGYWAFSVAAIDGVGNVGAAARIMVRADKFQPYTTISDVDAKRNAFGTIDLSIIGRGFADDGFITRLAIDSDGKEPYDRVYELPERAYTIVSDRLLRLPELSDLLAGNYRIGLYHPSRGWYFTAPRLSVDFSGTVKFGDMGAPWKPTWAFEKPGTALISLTTIFMLVALIVPAIGIILSLRQVALVTGEFKTARLEAIALLEGKPMPELERKRAAERAIRRGAGLTAKFALTISLLVIFIVLLVSVPLGVSMLRTQSQILAQGLEQRARVLLESAVQGAKSYLPAKNLLELSLLPNQSSGVAEASYLTITGFGATPTTNPDVVWASNDPDIDNKVDGSLLVPGASILTDSLSARVPAMAAEIDNKAQAEAGAIAEAIQQLQDEGRTLAANLDAASQERLTLIAASARDLEKTLGEKLASIADASIASEPAFDSSSIGLGPSEYIFYKPVLFRQGRESIYYRGLVRLSVSTETIVQQVRDARATLIRGIFITAAIALLVGVAGSFGLSRIIIGPLMKVVKGIETIRDQPDKKQLANFSIAIDTHDELSVLAGSINEMTSGLVKAAKEAEFLTVGKEVQKKYIPLQKNNSGEKMTVGFHDSPTHSFFGYYEGAKGVSGDYFDYKELDGRRWAFIKCDASGKGVPAALLMVSVATIFATTFKGWDYDKDGIHLDKLTYKINDYLEQLGFAGLFAAFVMGIYDSQTGEVILCHAGDNLVRVYSQQTRTVITHTLPEAPAAGSIPNFLVEMKTPYQMASIKLEKGDTLLLYTDGFEEATRARRGPDFKELYEILVSSDSDGNKTEHSEPLVEQLEEYRIKEITEAIMSRGSYTLTKVDDPLGDDMHYDFDFSVLEASPEDLVMGLAAVEKVFRLVPDPKASDDDKIMVDVRVDRILAMCWKQYPRFCSMKKPLPDPRIQEYLYYMGIKEDEQYDDLTMMLIRRK